MKRIGVSELRKYNAKALHGMTEPVEICHKNQPIRVLMPFAQFMEMQENYLKMVRLVEERKP